MEKGDIEFQSRRSDYDAEPNSCAPHFGRVYFEWGNLLKYQGKLGEAIEKYRKLSELNPKSYVAYKFWADTLKQQGKLEEAEEMFRRASEVDPTIHRGK